jgi:hypothetical protein
MPLHRLLAGLRPLSSSSSNARQSIAMGQTLSRDWLAEHTWAKAVLWLQVWTLDRHRTLECIITGLTSCEQKLPCSSPEPRSHERAAYLIRSSYMVPGTGVVSSVFDQTHTHCCPSRRTDRFFGADKDRTAPAAPAPPVSKVSSGIVSTHSLFAGHGGRRLVHYHLLQHTPTTFAGSATECQQYQTCSFLPGRDIMHAPMLSLPATESHGALSFASREPTCRPSHLTCVIMLVQA